MFVAGQSKNAGRRGYFKSKSGTDTQAVRMSPSPAGNVGDTGSAPTFPTLFHLYQELFIASLFFWIFGERFEVAGSRGDCPAAQGHVPRAVSGVMRGGLESAARGVLGQGPGLELSCFKVGCVLHFSNSLPVFLGQKL